MISIDKIKYLWFFSIKVDEGWFNIVLNLDLEQVYELDIEFYTELQIDLLNEPHDKCVIPYVFDGLDIFIYNEQLEQIIKKESFNYVLQPYKIQ